MAIKPVVKELVVAEGRDAAFERFTAELNLWWPRRTHSVFTDGCAEVVMECHEGGRLYEVSEEGEEVEWGHLTCWDPPVRVAFTWHPGRAPETAQKVEVTFRAVEDGTRVRVEHGGWEALGAEAAKTRDDYEAGWLSVLAEYEEGASAATS